MNQIESFLMKKLLLFSVILFGCSSLLHAQENKVILITLDGLRWQELFSGADSLLINTPEISGDVEALKDEFWRASPKDRRELLFPFIWGEVESFGMIAGNRWEGSKVDLTNQRVFSYPGYNEILTGFADDENINSNNKVNNHNVTVLEVVNNDPEFNGRVLAFGSWDVFPYIINEERSGIPVNAGYIHARTDSPTEKEQLINKIQDETPRRWGSVRYDTFTHNYALEAIKREHPRLVYISYGETDDFAHNELYDHYLYSARVTDGMIKELWEYSQSDPFYKDQTTFIITTDHGRGWGLEDDSHWRGHGIDYQGANSTWIIAFGNGVSTEGELRYDSQLYSNQIAGTVAELLGVQYDGSGKAGESLKLE
jgi:hypothetical protein